MKSNTCCSQNTIKHVKFLKCFEECLECKGREVKGKGESKIMKGFIICTLHPELMMIKFRRIKEQYV